MINFTEGTPDDNNTFTILHCDTIDEMMGVNEFISSFDMDSNIGIIDSSSDQLLNYFRIIHEFFNVTTINSTIEIEYFDSITNDTIRMMSQTIASDDPVTLLDEIQHILNKSIKNKKVIDLETGKEYDVSDFDELKLNIKVRNSLNTLKGFGKIINTSFAYNLTKNEINQISNNLGLDVIDVSKHKLFNNFLSCITMQLIKEIGKGHSDRKFMFMIECKKQVIDALIKKSVKHTRELKLTSSHLKNVLTDDYLNKNYYDSLSFGSLIEYKRQKGVVIGLNICNDKHDDLTTIKKSDVIIKFKLEEPVVGNENILIYTMTLNEFNKTKNII